MRTSPNAVVSLVALVVAAASIGPTDARADVDVVEVHVDRAAEHAGATILIRPVIVVGDGVQTDTHHVEGTAVGAYDDTVTATLDSLGIHGEATGTQRTSIMASGDALTISSTASISGSKTISGVVKTDQGSSAGDTETCNVSFKVSKPSVYSFVATMNYTGAGGGLVALPDGQQVQVPSGFQPVQLSIVRTGRVDPTGSGGQPLNIVVRLFNGNGIGTIAPPVTQFNAAWSFTFDVRPEQPPGNDIHWTKTSGGAFGINANWNPQQVPVKDVDHTDNAIFDVAGGYAVDFAAAKIKALGPPRHGDRLEILEGNVTFQSANLTVDDLDLARPSLTVDAAKLTIASGHVTSNSATIGSAHAADAEVRVDGGDSLWNCLGRLRIGGATEHPGTGRLTITNGAGVTSVDTRIGAGGQPGAAKVSGTGSTWNTDNVHIGFSSSGSLEIVGGAEVTSAIANVGGTSFLEGGSNTGNNVFVHDVDAGGTSSRWRVTNLVLGKGALASVTSGGRIDADTIGLNDGGKLSVFGLDTGSGRAPRAACNFALVGGQDSLLEVGLGGDVEITAGNGQPGTLLVGPAVLPLGAVRVFGKDQSTGTKSKLHTDGEIRVSRGQFSVADGAQITSGKLSIGVDGIGNAAVRGTGTLWAVTGDVEIGASPQTTIGILLLDSGGALSASGSVHLGAAGFVVGDGHLVALGGINVEGTIAPSIVQQVDLPLAPITKAKHPPVKVPSTLTVDGDLTVGATGVVRVDAGGPESDHVVVTGDATLGGTLVVQFMNGYAPKAGEHFDVVRAGGQTTGDFATVDVRGLAPGAQFTTATVGGTRTMTAVANTSPLPTVSIKAATKRAKEKSKKPIVLTLSRKGDASQALLVSYEVGGTAGNGLDCVTLPGAVTIPARKRSAKVKLILVDDFRHEGDETVTVTVLPGANYTHSLAATARITIADND